MLIILLGMTIIFLGLFKRNFFIFSCDIAILRISFSLVFLSTNISARLFHFTCIGITTVSSCKYFSFIFGQLSLAKYDFDPMISQASSQK